MYQRDIVHNTMICLSELGKNMKKIYPTGFIVTIQMPGKFVFCKEYSLNCLWELVFSKLLRKTRNSFLELFSLTLYGSPNFCFLLTSSNAFEIIYKFSHENR
jgi:hypothetical protein